ncbi:MAG: hypothetical protein ABIJ65_14365 [Chloroflexota bacterium]
MPARQVPRTDTVPSCGEGRHRGPIGLIQWLPAMTPNSQAGGGSLAGRSCGPVPHWAESGTVRKRNRRQPPR